MTGLNSFRSLLLSCVFVFASIFSANAATFVVNTTADTQDETAGNGVCADVAGVCSLRAAITEANALAGADIITLPAGTYTQTLVSASENLNAGGDFDITSEITINGAGSGTTIIEANALPATATERVVHCITAATAVFINDVTIRHGNYNINTFGGGIRLETATTNLTLNRVVVRDNRSAGSGGGIHFATSGGISLTVNNSSILNNSAGSSVASSGGSGAGINVSASGSAATITDSTITGNTINSTVASTFGAGLNVTGANSNVTVTRSTINNNSSTSTFVSGLGFAGGLYNQQATLIINNSTISGNSASSFHGGIRALSSTTAAATTTITESTVSNNTAVGEGGGVVNIAGSTFNSTMNIIRSTVSGNMANGTTSLGGGVENFTTSTGLGVVNLTNSTVSGNSANIGGGVYNSGTAATVNLNFSTVASNSAPGGGGGLLQTAGGGVINLKNSIVADNSGSVGPDISGVITSQDYNHVENTSGGTFLADSIGNTSKIPFATFLLLPNDVTGTDPQLGALANNGGPTFTHLPAGASPVKDTIPNATNDCGNIVTNDQRNIVRPQGPGGCDKGAAEIMVTAAFASIDGRILTAGGQGIRNVIVEISGGTLPNPVRVYTGSFGYYRFADLGIGETYIVTIYSKKHHFNEPTRVVTLFDNVNGFDFIGSE